MDTNSNQSFKDIASGLNDKLNGLLRLLQALPVLQPDYLVCSYSDRLSRFGTKIIEHYCATFGTKNLYIEEHTLPNDLEKQLVCDVLAVLTSFAGKLHRSRRGNETSI